MDNVSIAPISVLVQINHRQQAHIFNNRPQGNRLSGRGEPINLIEPLAPMSFIGHNKMPWC